MNIANLLLPCSAVLAGATGGFLLARWLLRRLRPAARLVRQGAGSPLTHGLAGRLAAWRVPDAEIRRTLLASLARELAADVPVLLAPLPDHRVWLEGALQGRPGVAWSRDLRPDPAALFDAAAAIRATGDPLLLVEGPSALGIVPPAEGEEDALEELFEDRPAPLGVLVLLLPREAPEVGADLELLASEAGLVDGTGRLRFVRWGDGWRPGPPPGG